MDRSAILALLRNTVDYPTRGNINTDVSQVLRDPALRQEFVDGVLAKYGSDANSVIAVDSMGFPLGAIIAQALACPLSLTRKGHRILPDSATGRVLNSYKSEEIGLRRASVRRGDRVLIVDDVMGSGGTFLAVARIVEELGGTVAGGAHLVDLAFGGDKWPGVMSYPHYFHIAVTEAEYERIHTTRARTIPRDFGARLARKMAWLRTKASQTLGR